MAIDLQPLAVRIEVVGAGDAVRDLAQVSTATKTTGSSFVKVGESAHFANEGATKLRRGFEELARESVGVSGPVGRLAEGLLLFGGGGTLVLAVAAGITAIGFAYEKLTEKSRKLKEQTDETRKSLEKQLKAQEDLAFGPVRGQQVASADLQRFSDQRDRLTKEIADIRALRTAEGTSISEADDIRLTPLLRKLESVNAQIEHAQKLVTVATGNVAEQGVKQLTDAAEQLTRYIALGKADRAGAASFADYLHKIATERHLTNGQALTDQRQVLALLESEKSIREALNPKETAHATAAASEADALRDQVGILKELAAVRPLTTAETERLAAIIQRLDAVQARANQTDKDQLELLKARIEAMKLLIAATVPAAEQAAFVAEGQRRRAAATAPAPDTFTQTFPTGGQNNNPDTLLNPPEDPITARINAALPGIMAAGQKELDYLKSFGDDATDLAAGIAQSIGDGLASGFQTLFEGGTIGAGIKQFAAAILGGLGEAAVRFGVAVIKIGGLMKKILSALASLGPVGAIAAGAALVALGKTLGGAAQSSFGGNGSATSSTAPQIIYYEPSRQALIGSTKSAMAASTLTPVQPVTVNATIIGPNDPTAQRQIGVLIKNAAARGLT